MNHNFANWEITQLLPEKNPYSSSYWYKTKDDFKIISGFKHIHKKMFIHSEGYQIHPRDWCKLHYWGIKYFYLRQAWSWEDIRLYLLSKGYVYDITYKVDSIDEYNHQILWYFNILSLSRLEHGEDFTYYSSYEECREAAILFILNELKTWD